MPMELSCVEDAESTNRTDHLQSRVYLDSFTAVLGHEIANMTPEELSSFDSTLLSSLTVIRTERSSRAHIGKLSIELLVSIFEYACAPPAALCDDSLASLPNTRFLVAITHVCRRWRAAALGCSTLWATFPARSKLAQAFSERARAVPLTIHANVDTGRSFTRKEEGILRRLAPRIGTLHVYLACPYLFRMFKSTLRTAMTSIASLTIRLCRCDIPSHTHDERALDIFGDEAGALRSLTLDYGQQWLLPRDHLPHVTELNVFNRDGYTTEENLEDLLELLSNTPMLETLTVHDRDNGVTSVGNWVHRSSRRICLPRLRRLSLALWTSTETGDLFSKLAVPEDAAIALTAYWVGANVLAHVGEWTQVVHRQTLAAPSTFSACTRRSSIQYGLHSSDLQGRRGLQDLLEVYKKDLTNVRVLRFEGPAPRSPRSHNLRLCLIAEHMPTLTHLSLRDYRGNIISQLSAILTQCEPVLCPNLTSITLSILAPRLLLSDLRPLLHATELRASNGFPLTRLTICTPPYSGPHPNDVSIYNVHGLTWLSFCSRDLYYGGEDEKKVIARPDWSNLWPTRLQTRWYGDIWRVCEEVGPGAPIVVQHCDGSGTIVDFDEG